MWFSFYASVTLTDRLYDAAVVAPAALSSGLPKRATRAFATVGANYLPCNCPVQQPFITPHQSPVTPLLVVDLTSTSERGCPNVYMLQASIWFVIQFHTICESVGRPTAVEMLPFLKLIYLLLPRLIGSLKASWTISPFAIVCLLGLAWRAVG